MGDDQEDRLVPVIAAVGFPHDGAECEYGLMVEVMPGLMVLLVPQLSIAGVEV